MDIGSSWTKISDALYYTSIAFAPTTYNMAECREWLGHYYLVSGEYGNAKENFGLAFAAIKDKVFFYFSGVFIIIFYYLFNFTCTPYY
jgi:hypothetical protein